MPIEKLGEALHISRQTPECEALGKRIYETETGRQVFQRLTYLNFIEGYYGYGKTYGIGAYIICKVREKGWKYIYVDMYRLNRKTNLDIRFLSLYDIVKALHYALNESGIPETEFTNEYIIDTNIENLKNLLKNLEKIDEEEYSVDKSMTVSIYNTIFNSLGNTPLYIIIDQLERVATDLQHSIATICDEVRGLYDASKNVKVVLLMQRAVVVKQLRRKPSCQGGDSPRGIAYHKHLKGYEPSDYENILQAIYGLSKDNNGDKKEEASYKKLLEKLSVLPPRVVFDQLISKSDNIKELEENLEYLLRNTREELYLRWPKSRELTRIIEQFIQTLIRERNLRKYEKVSTKIAKVYKYKIKCNGKSITLCVDLRSRRLKGGDADCDIKLVNEDGILRLNGDNVVEIGHFLAAFSTRETVLEGLDDFYTEIKDIVISKVGHELTSSCVSR